MNAWFERVWYGTSYWWVLLLPLTLLYRVILSIRALKFRLDKSPDYRPEVPVIVVGNLTVGGTGKTPLTLALVKFFKEKGLRPGVVSRGYGGRAEYYPHPVKDSDLAATTGDEPLLIKRHTMCPVVVDPDRARGLRYLIEDLHCNLIISDDGLQHYRLKRDIELVVIDGQRKLGNGHCLPSGPLREPASRLQTVDFIVTNGASDIDGGFKMLLKPTNYYSLDRSESLPLTAMSGKTVNAVAGIGNPERFFLTLEQLGVTIVRHAFPDHHHFVPDDIRFDNGFPVIMTEKDAVKFSGIEQGYCKDGVWYLEVESVLSEVFYSVIEQRLISIASPS